MSSALFRLGRSCFNHKWWVIAAWTALLAILITLVGVLQPKFAKDFDLPGTDGGVAMEQMTENFPEITKAQEEANTTIVVAALKPGDNLTKHTEQINKLVEELRTLPSIVAPQTVVGPVDAAKLIRAQIDAAVAAGKLPADQAEAMIATQTKQVLNTDQTVGLIKTHQSINMIDATAKDKEELTKILERNRVNGLQVEATGGIMQAQPEQGLAEVLGFAIAFVVMIVAFGAVVAAFIPLITGIVGVGITILALTLSTEFMSVNQAATGIVTMLGIAVSIDYALFIVSRYRSELKRGGAPADAAGRAVGTAGSAVVFAGLTVIIAVAALMVIGIPVITQMGFGAAIGVLVAVLTALTLIPALLGAAGKRTFTPKIPWIRQAEGSETAVTNGVRWGRFVVKHPIVVTIVGLAILVIAAIPATNMKLGMDVQGEDTVAAQKLMSKGFGEGVGGELFVVLHTDKGSIDAAATTAIKEIAALPDVQSPESLMWLGNGTPTGPDDQLKHTNANTALLLVTPKSGPSAPATHELVEKIRALSPSIAEQGAEIHVGGQTAILSDLSEKLSKALIPYLAVVVGLAFLIMIGVFRSLWVPLIGTVGFIFSVLATFGVTVLIFQEGALGLIANPKPILSFLPIFLIGVVFGLAMDYQVFLVSRMREEYIHGMPAKEAIVAGYRHGARVVVSAAIIMISVFSAFMLSPDTLAKMMGFALAIAIIFDAFIIRMAVVPAVIALLGDRAWGLPKWLDKLVFNFDIEGEAVRDRGLEAESANA